MTSNSNKTSSNNGVILHGYHTKLKTMRKKYFVLYEDCGKSLARLEYFDKEKQFRTKTKPKRTILLNSCFNINRRLDTKHDYVVTLSTKDESFGIVMDTEEEMNKWLKEMLKLQSGQNILQGQPKPFYEHVWQVVVQKKGLAEKKGILGSYHVCLSSKSVTLIRIGPERTDLDEPRVPVVEFYLTSIRRCGDSKRYFYMEVGRHSVIGAGELWMETKDYLIAQNMHTMILNVMSSNAEDSYGPMRKRSSSATETSKPVTILQRRQTHSGSKTLNSSPLSAMNRDRCDSLPSRNRTTTESSTNSFDNASMPPSRTMSSLNTVPNSNYNRHSHSPPMNSNALSPSMGCSESDGSTLSIDETDSMKISLTPDDNASFMSRFYNSLSPGGVIPEESVDEYWYTENKKLNCYNIDNVDMHPGDRRKTLSCSSNIHSEEAESQYVDMSTSKSPCENALCDNSSDGNSRTSSIAEETVDGYVHMSSPQTSDYVDMEQAMKQRRQMYNNAYGKAPTRMANLYFEEYPLEEISTDIFVDDEESQVLTDRPPRAYSVGSRIEHNKQRPRIEVVPNIDQNNSRVRAFSVGSRSKVPRCDLQRNTLMAAAHSAAANNINVNTSKSSVASIEPTSESTGRGRKSSSAPLLIHKSQNSVDRMDDLMEIDFSKNSTSRSNSLSSQSPGASSLHLPKGSHLRSKLSSSPGQSAVSNRSHDSFSEITEQTVDNGYLEMRPVIYTTNQNNFNESIEQLSVPNDDSSNIDLPETPEHQPDATHNIFKVDEWKVETPEGYLEMSWNGNKNLSYSNIDQIMTNNRHLMNDIANATIKSRSMTNDLKKSRAVSKMPSNNTGQILKNNRSLGAGNVSKLSALHTQNQAMQRAAGVNLPNKSESNLRKRFFDHANNSFTISEEKTTGTEQDTHLDHRLQDLIISSMYIEDEASNKDDTSPVDNECPPSIDLLVDSTKQDTTPKKSQIDVVEREKIRDVDCQMNTSDQSIDTICDSHSMDESKETERKPLSTSADADSSSEDVSKFARKSNSPKCTPTSPFSSSSRCHRHSNPNRQTKGTGYELLHISSDSSLQTRRNLSRPSSVNSDRIFTPDATSSRPSSVNSDCVQLNSSSTATLCLSPSNTCDNREQDQVLKSALTVSNNAFNDDNKLKNIDCVSSTKYIAANELTNSPGSKPTGQGQNTQNPILELNYASLDLPQNSNTTIHGSVNQSRSSTSDDTSVVSLSPNSNTSQQSTFTYAKIDFNQCDGKKFKCAGTQNYL